MKILFADDILNIEYPPEREVEVVHVDTPERAIRRLQHSLLAGKSDKYTAPSYNPFDVIFLGNAEMVPVARWIKEHDYPAPVLIHSSVEEDKIRLLQEFRGFHHRITDKRGNFLRDYDRARPIDLSTDLDRDIKVKPLAS
jgi:hypothetical protein